MPDDDPREQVLERIYHDTDDLRLAAADISVWRERQRRSEGDEIVWVTELPGAGGADEQLHVPDEEDDSAVPAPVLDLVGAHLRGGELEPVAHNQITRTSWELRDQLDVLLAAVSCDAVSAQTLGESTTVTGWTEYSVELPGAGKALRTELAARITEAGGVAAEPTPVLRRLYPDRLLSSTSRRRRARLRPKSTAGEVVLAYASQQVDAIKTYDPRVRRDEPDAVHQMRVAIRRLRAALQSFGRVIDRDATRSLTDELRWLGAALGSARDQEVVLERLEDLLDETPAEVLLGPVAAQLRKHVTRGQSETRAAIADELNGCRYFALLDRLDDLRDNPPLTELAARPARSVLPALVAKSFRRLDRAAAAVPGEAPGPGRDTAIHSTRKAAKRARYAAEAVAAALGRQAQRSGRDAKRLQTLLGEHHDTVLTRSGLREFGARAHLAGHNGFTFGLWYAQEAQRADEIEAELPRALRRTARGKRRRWMR